MDTPMIVLWSRSADVMISPSATPSREEGVRDP